MKILLAGLGSIGQRHARNLRTLLGDQVELMAYRVRGRNEIIAPDVRSSVDGDVAAHLGIRVFRQLDAALAAQPDVVFVTNPNACHMSVALAAARAGCQLFIEKPLSHSLDGVDELTDLVERRSLVCMVGYQLRFHPAFITLARWLHENTIGRLLGARLVFGEPLPLWHPYEDYRGSYVSARNSGGGVLLTQIHDLDYAYALFGRPVRLYAVGGHLSELEIDAEDTASVLMECIVDGRRVPVHLQQDCASGPKRRQCEITGERGSLRLDFEAATVERFDEYGNAVVSEVFPDYDRNNMFLDELRHFLACLRREAQPLVGLRDARVSLEMALAARESIEAASAVALPA